MFLKRRTFQAQEFPPGSKERAELNKSSVTSEYLPSYRYVLCDDQASTTPTLYRSKREATANFRYGCQSCEWLGNLREDRNKHADETGHLLMVFPA
jgi:hypothetical protein